jgi:hypothetical protein
LLIIFRYNFIFLEVFDTFETNLVLQFFQPQIGPNILNEPSYSSRLLNFPVQNANNQLILPDPKIFNSIQQLYDIDTYIWYNECPVEYQILYYNAIISELIPPTRLKTK